MKAENNSTLYLGWDKITHLKKIHIQKSRERYLL